ncbi:GSU3473 family protein [Trichloromonas sp.]|uniref:GSU3473 family protein n=1 Tax=Trichloromonas sp. TaxID=3069249 RepID=UPI003D812BB8
MVEVFPEKLEALIASSRVCSFERNGGWVALGRDPVRGHPGGVYEGEERRQCWVTSLD